MRRPFLIIVILLGLSGCYSYSPVEIYVFDAQTKQPIEGIRIDPFYHRFMEFFPPKLDPAFTNEKGVAQMDICTNYKSGYAGLALHADQYFLDQPEPKSVVDLSIEQLRATQRDRFRIEIGMLKLEEFRRRRPMAAHNQTLQWTGPASGVLIDSEVGRRGAGH